MLLAGIGELLWDIYPDKGEKFPGGATFNCVHHARLLGHEGIIVSRIGNDSAGNELLTHLDNGGFKREFIQVDDIRETGYVTVRLDNKGEPAFQCSESAPYDYLEWDERFVELAQTADAVVFGTFGQRNKQSASVTQRFLALCTNAVKVFDVNFREWNDNTVQIVKDSLPLTDIVKMNEPELKKMQGIYPDLPDEYPDFLSGIAKKADLEIACLTADKWGCLISDGSEVVYCPGIKTKPIDKTGAGDAFITAFVIGYLENMTLSQAGNNANKIARHTLMRRGATPDYSVETIKKREDGGKEYNIYKKWRKFIVKD